MSEDTPSAAETAASLDASASSKMSGASPAEQAPEPAETSEKSDEAEKADKSDEAEKAEKEPESGKAEKAEKEPESGKAEKAEESSAVPEKESEEPRPAAVSDKSEVDEKSAAVIAKTLDGIRLSQFRMTKHTLTRLSGKDWKRERSKEKDPSKNHYNARARTLRQTMVQKRPGKKLIRWKRAKMDRARKLVTGGTKKARRRNQRRLLAIAKSLLLKRKRQLKAVLALGPKAVLALLAKAVLALVAKAVLAKAVLALLAKAVLALGSKAVLALGAKAVLALGAKAVLALLAKAVLALGAKAVLALGAKAVLALVAKAVLALLAKAVLALGAKAVLARGAKAVLALLAKAVLALGAKAVLARGAKAVLARGAKAVEVVTLLKDDNLEATTVFALDSVFTFANGKDWKDGLLMKFENREGRIREGVFLTNVVLSPKYGSLVLGPNSLVETSEGEQCPGIGVFWVLPQGGAKKLKPRSSEVPIAISLSSAKCTLPQAPTALLMLRNAWGVNERMGVGSLITSHPYIGNPAQVKLLPTFRKREQLIIEAENKRLAELRRAARKGSLAGSNVRVSLRKKSINKEGTCAERTTPGGGKHAPEGGNDCKLQGKDEDEDTNDEDEEDEKSKPPPGKKARRLQPGKSQ
eukprot:g65478.t1